MTTTSVYIRLETLWLCVKCIILETDYITTKIQQAIMWAMSGQLCRQWMGDYMGNEQAII